MTMRVSFVQRLDAGQAASPGPGQAAFYKNARALKLRCSLPEKDTTWKTTVKLDKEIKSLNKVKLRKES